MSTRSLELFKALVEASFWFYTHPKDTSYRIIYNKSRYTLDKVRIMKMLRLYLPFVRRLDDQALITYLYRSGGVVMAQMESGQLANLVSISENLPNALQAAGEANPSVVGESIDQVIAEEEKKQKEKVQEQQNIQSSPAKKPPPFPDKTRLEDLATRAEKSGIVVADSGGAVIAPRAVNPKIILTQPTNLQGSLVVANKSGIVAPGPGKLVVSAGSDQKIGTGLLGGTNGKVLDSSKPQGRLINPLNDKATGPTKFERMVGGVMRQSSGAPVVGLGRNLASKSEVFVKRQGIDRLRDMVGGWFGGGSRVNQTVDYEVEDEDEEEFWGDYPSESEEQKKGWSFLGLGGWWWVVIIFFLILVILSANTEQETARSGEKSSGGGSSGAGGGATSSDDYSVCQYTRAGASRSIGSTILAGWIRDAAIKEGIPPAILASVAMHENPDFTANAKNDHDAIVADRMCNKSPSFCVLRGQVLHTKAYSTGENDPCTGAELEQGAQTAQAVGLMQFLDIYNPGQDLCSITTSLGLAAAKLKGSGIGDNPSEAEVNKAIKEYHASCYYNSYNYCQEVYEDFKNCTPKLGKGTDSCRGGWPVSGTITQGPWGGSHYVYKRVGAAVDIATGIGTPVYATFDGIINDLSYTDTGPVDGRGIFVSITPESSEVGGNTVSVRYLHFSKMAEGLRIGDKVGAGDLIGYVGMTGRADGPHLHMDFSNIEMVKPYVPEAILPVDCTTTSCRPQIITACKI